MRDPQSLSRFLDGVAVNGPALRRARTFALLTATLTQWSAEPWVRQLRVANVRGETIVIFSSSAAALVPLRHRAPSFLSWLNETHGLRCTRLETKVQPLPR